MNIFKGEKRPLDSHSGENIWDTRKLQRLASIILKKEEEENAINIILPVEVIQLIFTFCYPFELLLPLVCKHWHIVWKTTPLIGPTNPEHVVKSFYDLTSRSNEIKMELGALLEMQETWKNQTKDLIEQKENADRFANDMEALRTRLKSDLEQRDRVKSHIYPKTHSSRVYKRWCSAALGGCIPVLEYLRSRHLKNSRLSDYLPGLTSSGKQIIDIGGPFVDAFGNVGVDIAESAARGGHVQVMEWFRTNTQLFFGHRIAEIAADRGNWDVLWFAAEHGLPCTSHVSMKVAEAGDLPLLKALRGGSNPAAWDARTCIWAIAKGHTDLLEWAIANGCPRPPKA